MARRPEIGNVQLYPNRPLNPSDKNGFVLKFYCPIQNKRIRKNCGTHDRREARRILRECRQRLLDGRYIESEGAITDDLELATVPARVKANRPSQDSDRTWHECFEDYYAHRKSRGRSRSLTDAASRIGITERILDARHDDTNSPGSGSIRDYTSLEALEYLQDRLLAGDESRNDMRSPVTVNTMIGAVMAFVRYCHRHGWIDRVPPIEKLDTDDVMKGRPISGDEFQRMRESVPSVVGERSAASWNHVLDVLWESAFRIGEVMDFSWDDERQIHPVWPKRKSQHPTIIVPSSQKNKKSQEIPMLPGLQALLEKTPKRQRNGWVVNPLRIDQRARSKPDWFKPTAEDLAKLSVTCNNSAIARACGVTETCVRKWLAKSGIKRAGEHIRQSQDIEDSLISSVRSRAERLLSQPARRTEGRLTKERVSRFVSKIGEAAKVVVQQPNAETGRRIKYASAHDIRRSCAHRLINAGVSAEAIKVILRHKDFATTERYYGATRTAQSAAAEIHERLSSQMGALDPSADGIESLQLNPGDRKKLRRLLDGL